MRLSLPFRIFSVHLVFMVALGLLGLWMVTRTFEDYRLRWEQQLEPLPVRSVFRPLANEVARSLLLEVEAGADESQQRDRSLIGEGLDRVLGTLPGLERLAIVDSAGNLQYASAPADMALTLASEDYAALFESEDPSQRQVRLRSGQLVTEIILPVFGDEPESDEPKRLGAVLVHYRPDSATVEERTDGPAEADPTPLVRHDLDNLARELGRAVLLYATLDEAEDSEESYQQRVSDGLDKVLRELPIESLIIVDPDLRIQYVNDPNQLDLTFTDPDYLDLFASEVPRRHNSEGSVEEWMVPVFDQLVGPERRRLGSLLIRYRPDPGLLARNPQLTPPGVDTAQFLMPLILFLSVAVGGGIVLAALTGWPVRRVERALADYRARGFKGQLAADDGGLPKELQSTVQAIRELGGRLEALDARGRERESLLATLSQTLEDGMVTLDPGGMPVAWNPAALRILGVEPEAAGEPGEVPAAAERLRETIQRSPDLLFTVEHQDATEAREVEILHVDGSTRVVRVTRVPVEVDSDETGSLLLIRDLAALRKVETHLLEAGRFAVLAHLAASLAHEIRNPLHAIQLNASVVEEYVDISGDDKGSRAVADSLASIRNESKRLAGLLNNYLGMVRPGQEVGPIDLRELSRRVIQLVDYLAKKANVEIRLEGEETPPIVMGIADRLQQAILNLVLNAIQAMPDGGLLTLHVTSSIGVVRLSVSDTGIGLRQELADQLFDTRVTTKTSGSGLGLPLVRLIAESHGGGVWYRSRLGKGTSFTVVLPARPHD